jgi:hypothetical protein
MCGCSAGPVRRDHFELIHQLAAKFRAVIAELALGNRLQCRDIFRGRAMRAVTAFSTLLRWPVQIAAAVALAASLSSAGAAEVINVIMDQAKIAPVPDRTATLVVGNPLIADVTVQAGGTMVVTGKGYGVTNVIALDHAGKVLSDKLVRVKGPLENVVVYRGMTRESYSCAPNCERRITLGDTPEFFDTTLTQTAVRNNRALTGQAPPPGTR